MMLIILFKCVLWARSTCFQSILSGFVVAKSAEIARIWHMRIISILFGVNFHEARPAMIHACIYTVPYMRLIIHDKQQSALRINYVKKTHEIRIEFKMFVTFYSFYRFERRKQQ